MNIILPGDKDYESRPSVQRKSLRINLNENIYGTFVEIGAGQEVARHFYRVGAASGTIAKSMSAYDKSFSDSIYGKEEDSRYVTQNRLDKMLSHEMNLLEKRISRKKYPNKFFFVYANTVATIDFVKKFKGHGWMGIKFQTDPNDDYSEIKLHLRFHQNEAKLQQESLGIMGVNLIYGAFYKHNEPLKLMKYLYDHIDDQSIEIDTINFSGPLFKDVDNRLISLELVRLGMTDAVVFDETGTNVLPAQVLYKKNILTLRGSYRPITKVNEEMFKKSLEAFLEEKGVKKENTIVLLEITLSNLRSTGDIDDQSIEIDTINFSGPLFKDVDNRLISLELVRLGMTDAVVFDETGTNVLPAQVLYKKNILTLRGSYSPITKVNEEMFKKSLEAFLEEKGVKKENTIVLLEITLSNLRSAGDIDDSDYLDRAKLLCSLGHMVMISNFSEYYKLVKYLTSYTTKQLGLTMGVTNLVEIFDEKYYDGVKGGILAVSYTHLRAHET